MLNLLQKTVVWIELSGPVRFECELTLIEVDNEAMYQFP